MKQIDLPIDYSPAVQLAKQENLPLVALESTIIAHGMPFPENVDTARALEKLIIEQGAVPATIALWNGRIQIGLDDAKLEAFARKGASIPKVSRRDIPFVLARKTHGATTVSATMVLAHMAGIPIFATGGIGGVHRGVATSWDISADLLELARTPVTVVSAGAKSILDIPKTLEFLETQGVLVVGYQTHAFPAFYTRESGSLVNHRVNTPEEIAHLIAIQKGLGYTSGMLIANPVPKDKEANPDLIQQALQNALKELDQEGISGKEVTPFLLRKIASLTQGKSLVSNIELAKNNATLAGQIAVAYQNE
ncbi:MAG: pseudouridine-5'-phosphate glycosidase [Saprospiraceae bacterium]|nr:pseudouridine-5'-phosphate glycosidase [Saprospiraceae bacterium]